MTKAMIEGASVAALLLVFFLTAVSVTAAVRTAQNRYRHTDESARKERFWNRILCIIYASGTVLLSVMETADMIVTKTVTPSSVVISVLSILTAVFLVWKIRKYDKQ